MKVVDIAKIAATITVCLVVLSLTGLYIKERIESLTVTMTVTNTTTITETVTATITKTTTTYVIPYGTVGFNILANASMINVAKGKAWIHKLDVAGTPCKIIVKWECDYPVAVCIMNRNDLENNYNEPWGFYYTIYYRAKKVAARGTLEYIHRYPEEIYLVVTQDKKKPFMLSDAYSFTIYWIIAEEKPIS